MRLGRQVNQGTMIGQHMSTLAIKVWMLLIDNHNNCKQLTFMSYIVGGGASQLFAVIGDWLQPVALILVQQTSNAII